MLTIQNLEFHQGSLSLFERADLQLFHGQRMGLVGRNGCGKSTLLRLIRGELHPDGGDINLHRGVSIASVAQEIDNAIRPAIEFVLDGDVELRELENMLRSDTHDTAYFQAQQRFEAIDGYAARARGAQLLDGLGFLPSQIEAPVNSFSGGWRMRLNLARALMRRADLLLLDEPTNHLDLEAILWLEQYLAKYPGSLILVSHDRDFLNTVVERIAHIDAGKIRIYPGDYDSFEEARAEHITQQNALYAQQSEQVEQLERFITRFRAKASKARQAQSRIKALARMERVAKLHVAEGYTLDLPSPERAPQILLRLEQAAFRYGDDQPFLFQHARLTLRPGDRIALLGPNGAGKSTLIKLLAGRLPPSAGLLERTPQIKIGYFAQHQLEQLDPGISPMQHMQRLDPQAQEQILRNFLGRYGFASTESERPIRSFSGGEKSRLALAGLAWSRPHLLLLDEPTNHLDMDMRDALLLALQEYQGAMVLVSHDRHLLRSCADQLILVADGQAQVFDGDLDDYQNWLLDRARQQAPVIKKPPSPRPAAQNSKGLLQKQARVETQMARLEDRIRNLDEALAAAYIAGNSGETQGLHGERTALQGEYADLETTWLALEEALQDNLSG